MDTIPTRSSFLDLDKNLIIDLLMLSYTASQLKLTQMSLNFHLEEDTKYNFILLKKPISMRFVYFLP